MTASELASIESIKSAPRFADAWKKARETVARLPPEKVLAKCQSIMAIKPRAR